MKIGAQLYSVNNKCQSIEGIRETFLRMKEIGYVSVQLSGFPYDADEVKAIADEVGMHIGLTHTPIPDIIERTDEVIRKHKTVGADTVGIGSPGSFVEGNTVRYVEMVEALAPAVKRIQEAGLNFAYHNHFLEFVDQGGFNIMDYLYENTNWNFILDTGWVHYTGTDVIETINKYKDRLKYVHLKDFREAREDDKSFIDRIVPMYQGNIDFDSIINALIEVGTTEIAYVEQDNASLAPDPYLDMQHSYEAIAERGFGNK